MSKKCNCCLKEKEEYISGICKECSDGIDNYLIKASEDAPLRK